MVFVKARPKEQITYSACLVQCGRAHHKRVNNKNKRSTKTGMFFMIMDNKRLFNFRKFFCVSEGKIHSKSAIIVSKSSYSALCYGRS